MRDTASWVEIWEVQRTLDAIPVKLTEKLKESFVEHSAKGSHGILHIAPDYLFYNLQD